MSATMFRPSKFIMGMLPYSSHVLTKNLPVILKACRCESSLPSIKSERISGNIRLKTIQVGPQSNRPLVLLFGWMAAKPRHLDKYANLYHSKGFDVLTVQMQPTQVLRPRRAQRTVEEVLTVLEDSSLKEKALMVHGFSVGGYMYGEMLLKMSEQRERWSNVRNRMVAQIFDSPVDFDAISVGFSEALLKNKWAQTSLRVFLDAYLKVFEGPITTHYKRASDTFKRNELKLPSLLLYSRADPIGCHVRIEEVSQRWMTAGIPVMKKCWESSPHVSHFHRHADEYVEAILAFLDSVKLSQHSADKRDRHQTTTDSEQRKKIQRAL